MNPMIARVTVMAALLGSLIAPAMVGAATDDSARGEDASPSSSSMPVAAGDSTPTTRQRPVSFADMDLRTRQVERGIVKVLGDRHGHRLGGADSFDVLLDHIGNVWIPGLSREGEEPGAFVLGQPGERSVPPVEDSGRGLGPTPHLFDTDGRIWHASGYWGGVQVYDGTTWERIPGGRGVVGGPDGSVWFRLERHGDRGLEWVDIARHKDGAITTWDDVQRILAVAGGRRCGIQECGYPHIIAVAPDGRAWVASAGDIEAHPNCGPDARKRPFISSGLAYFDGQRWTSMQPLGPGEKFAVRSMAVGPDGNLWAIIYGERREAVLASYDGERWRTYEDAKGRPLAADGGNSIAVDADGTVWFETALRAREECTGLKAEAVALASFDGRRFDYHLAKEFKRLASRPVDGDHAGGLPGVHQILPAPDGSVWVHAGREGNVLYVITP